MRDDFVPPDSPVESKLEAALIREGRLRDRMHEWNTAAQAIGYDGVAEALASLAAIKRGPRSVGYMGNINGPGCDPDVP